MQNINQLIIVEQLPVISERLRAMSEEVSADVKAALSLECSEETVKQVKAVRSRLNKDFNALEDRRKDVKKAVLEPYEKFEAVYKEFVADQYRKADKELAANVATVEDELKRRKLEKVKAYALEYAESVGVLDYKDHIIGSLNVTLSASEKSLKDKARERADEIAGAITMIETLDDRDEIMVEYKRCMDAARAVSIVAERKKALEIQRLRQAEAEMQKAAQAEAASRVQAAIEAQAPPPEMPPAPLAPAVPEELPMYYQFKVLMTKAQAKALKLFLEEGGYQYE